MTSSTNHGLAHDSKEYQDWLSATLDKFPSLGPTVARRLIDILEPENDPSTVSDSDAA